MTYFVDPYPTPTLGLAKPSLDSVPVYDYKKMILTVAAETDSRLAVLKSVAGVTTDSELLIRVPDAEFWYVVPGTVKGLDNAAPHQAGQRQHQDPAQRRRAAASDRRPGRNLVRGEAVGRELHGSGHERRRLRARRDDSHAGHVAQRRRQHGDHPPSFHFPAATTSVETTFADIDFVFHEPRETLR